MMMQKAERVCSRQYAAGINRQAMFLLLTIYCLQLAVLYGCASTKTPEMSKTQIEAIDYNQRGVDATAAGSYDKALIEFRKSLKLNTSIDNQKGIAVNLLNLGRLYLLINKFDDAKVVFERAIRTAVNLNDQVILSEGYASLGRYYYLTGDNQNAVDVLEKALDIDRNQGYHAIGSRLNIIGMAYKDSNRPEDAEKSFHDALKSNKDYGMEADTADSFRGLGDVAVKKEDYKKAREFYENALAIDKKTGHHAHIVIDLYALGIVNLKENAAEKALDFFLRAYAVSISRGDDRMALKNLDNIIEIYTRLKDEKNGEIYSSEREKLLKKEKDYKK